MKNRMDIRQAVKILLIFSALVFFTIITFEPFLHHHEADGEEHHNCPVCILQVYLIGIPVFFIIHTLIIPQQQEKYTPVSIDQLGGDACHFSYFLRGPPQK